MSTARPAAHGDATGVIHVHYWAAAKAAAGVAGDDLPAREPLTLTEVRAHAAALHPGTRLAQVLETCSVLVGEQPVSAAPPDAVVVPLGASVEFLPPFAGG